MSEDSLASENYWKASEQKIPGSTRIPVDELKKFLDDKPGVVILDLGSGEGRSTQALKESFPEAKIVAFDLNHKGLEKTISDVSGRVQGTALELPFTNGSADGVVLCGVLTNITDKDPQKAVEARKKVIKEIARVLKPGGVLTVSDFNREHNLSHYPVNYSRHELITKELGTIAVFDPTAKITFQGKSDKEIALLASSPYLQRFAHHYSTDELTNLTESVSELKIVKHSAEIGTTPSGNPIDTLVATFIKSPKQAP